MKKLLSVLLVLTMIFNLLAVFAYDFGEDIEIADYGYMSQDGNVINTIYDETAVKGYLEVDNYSSEAISVLMVLSYYDASDKLLEVKATEVTTDEYRIYTPEISVSGDEGSYFKLFILKDKTSLMPITAVYPTYSPLAECALDETTYEDEIDKAIDEHIMSNESGWNFYADKPVTREELAVVISNLADEKQLSASVTRDTYNDVTIGEKNYSDINKVIKMGYMTVENGYFYPYKRATVNEAVVAANAVLNELAPGDYSSVLYDGVSLSEDDYISKGTLAKVIVNALDYIPPTYKLKVSYADVASAEADNSDNITFEYWASPTARDTSEITVAGDATVYINDVMDFLSVSELVDRLENFYGYVTFSQAVDSVYTTVEIENYETLIVDKNNKERCRIVPKNDALPIIYDPEDSYITAELYNMEGEPIDWETVDEYDVLAVKRYDTGINETVTAILLEDNILEGMVEGQSGFGYNTRFKIDGTFYDIAPDFPYDELMLGDKRIFYLDIMGNLAYYETAPLPLNYAYVVKIAQVSNGLDEYTAMKLYTSNDEYKTFYVASEVTLDGVSSIKGENLTDSDGGIAVTKTSFNDADWNQLITKQGEADIFGYNTSTDTLTIAALAKGDVITYETDSNGNITSIDRPAFKSDYAAGTNLKGKFVQNTTSAVDLEYNEKYGYFSGAGSRVYVDENTKIMVVDVNSVWDIEDLTKDDCCMFETSLLADEQILEDALIFNKDEDTDTAGLILVQADVEPVAEPDAKPDVEPELPASNMALVSGVGSANNDEGDPIYNVRVVQDGLVKDGKANAALTTVDDTVEIPVYSTIIPKYDAAGEIKDVDILAIYDGEDVAFDAGLITALEESNDKVCYYYGEVDGISRNILDLKNGDSISTTPNTYVYVYDNGLKTANSVRIEDLSYVTYDDYDGKFYVGRDEAEVYAIAREYDGEVVDLVLYVLRV